MLSTDRKVFEPGSDTASRFLLQSEVVAELHVIVLAKSSLGFKAIKLSDKVTVYPTNSRSRWRYGWDALKIAKKLGPAKIDWVTTQDPFETGLIGRAIARRLAARLQLQIHTDLLSPYFSKLSWLNWWRVILAKWLLPKADSVRVVSERIKNSLLQSGVIKPSDKIFVLPVFIDAAKYIQREPSFSLKNKYPQFKKIILMASRLTKEKNIALAMAVMGEIVLKYEQTGFLIVGEGPEKTHLAHLVSEKNLEDQVVWEPWTNDLFSYFQTADLFLLTSYYEGYGRTLVEAALAGLPIVTADVGCVGEVVKNDNGVLICPVGDQPAFVTAVSSILEQEKPPAPQNVSINLPTKEEFLATLSRSLA